MYLWYHFHLCFSLDSLVLYFTVRYIEIDVLVHSGGSQIGFMRFSLSRVSILAGYLASIFLGLKIFPFTHCHILCVTLDSFCFHYFEATSKFLKRFKVGACSKTASFWQFCLLSPHEQLCGSFKPLLQHICKECIAFPIQNYTSLDLFWVDNAILLPVNLLCLQHLLLTFSGYNLISHWSR